MTQARPIRVGVIGLHFGAQVHVPAFRRDARCIVAALAGRTPDRTAAVAAEIGVPGAYGDWRALLSEGAVDAVSIAVPPSEQPAVIIEAARRGIHVFCEKPLASTVDSAAEAVAAIRTSGVVHAIDFIFPEIPAWRRAQELLRAGAIGAVRHFSYVWRIATRSSRVADSWKSRSEEGGGVVLNLVSHVVFNIEWLLGTMASVDVTRPRNGRSAASFFDCVMYLENGIHGSVSVATDAYLGEGHRVTVFGDSGTIVLSNQTTDYASGFEVSVGTRANRHLDVVHRDAGSPGVDGRIAPVGSIAARFLDAIGGSGEAAPGLQDGLRVQRWLQHMNDAIGH